MNLSKVTSKRYTGTKTLKAWPATLGEYNAYRGWAIPEDEDPAKPGYMVEYEDGGAPNITNHAGYVSWSPADVFERTYFEIVPEDWHTRLTIEYKELVERIDKLRAFIARPTVTVMPDQMELMREQERHMYEYGIVLATRLRTNPPGIGYETAK